MVRTALASREIYLKNGMTREVYLKYGMTICENFILLRLSCSFPFAYRINRLLIELAHKIETWRKAKLYNQIQAFKVMSRLKKLCWTFTTFNEPENDIEIPCFELCVVVHSNKSRTIFREMSSSLTTCQDDSFLSVCDNHLIYRTDLR